MKFLEKALPWLVMVALVVVFVAMAGIGTSIWLDVAAKFEKRQAACAVEKGVKP